MELAEILKIYIGISCTVLVIMGGAIIKLLISDALRKNVINKIVERLDHHSDTLEELRDRKPCALHEVADMESSDPNADWTEAERLLTFAKDRARALRKMRTATEGTG